MNLLLSEVSSARGAPMGRREHHRPDRWELIELVVHVLPLVDGDYDEGGAYWGAGEPLWRAVEPEGKVEFFFRAKDRWLALDHVREEYPNVEILDTPRERWFEEFVMGYEECALWSSSCPDPTLDDPEEMVEGLEHYTIADSTKATMREECKEFCDFAEPELLAAMKCDDYNAGRAGHDFWLTRNRHGAGFWDRYELPKALRDKLSESAKNDGTRDLYIGDDGLVYQS